MSYLTQIEKNIMQEFIGEADVQRFCHIALQAAAVFKHIYLQYVKRSSSRTDLHVSHSLKKPNFIGFYTIQLNSWYKDIYFFVFLNVHVFYDDLIRDQTR